MSRLIARLSRAGRLPVTFTISILVFTASGAAAAEPPSAPRITEEDFLAALDHTHPARAEALAAVDEVRSQVDAAEAFGSPSLEVVREDPSGPTEQIEWAVSWPLPSASRRLEIAAREAGVIAAEARHRATQRSLRLEMRAVYAEWALAAARADEIGGLVERIDALVERERARRDHGETSDLAVHRLVLTATVLKARHATAVAAAEATRERARGWNSEVPRDARPALPALPGDASLGDSSLALSPEGLSLEELSFRLEPHSPRIQAAVADLRAADRERDVVRRFVRSPTVTAGWQSQKDGSASFDGPILGVSWPIPIFGGKRADRARAQSHLTQARARLITARRQTAAELAAAHVTYRRLIGALHEAQSALAGNGAFLTAAEAAFRHGEASVRDLEDALSAASEAQLAALDLRQAALTAQRELERLTGSVPQKPTNKLPNELSTELEEQSP